MSGTMEDVKITVAQLEVGDVLLPIPGRPQVVFLYQSNRGLQTFITSDGIERRLPLAYAVKVRRKKRRDRKVLV